MKSFDEWLKEGSKVEKEVLIVAEDYANKNGISLSEAMMDANLMSEDMYLQELAEYNETDFLTADEALLGIDESLISEVDMKDVEAYRFLPYNIDGEILKILVSDIITPDLKLKVSEIYGVEFVSPIFIMESEMEILISKYFAKDTGMDGVDIDEVAKRLRLKEDYSTSNFNTVNLEQADSVIDRTINEMIKSAIENSVSDIHIAPEVDNGASIRFRKDGILIEYASFNNRELLARIINKIKSTSEMKIEESRRAQDGHYSATYKGNNINFRVSSLPTVHGVEKIVMRILNQQALNLSLASMKFSPSIEKDFVSLIHKPQGIFLITGPTGSGKTTTLYTALAEIAEPEINIITLEDPSEYTLGKNIVQSQVNSNIGQNFATLMRAVLRQDPDVILVGEIRDIETAQIAVQAANTGHLVFSTLHTNDAISSLTRLIEMGVDTYNISDSLLAAMAQRLVRRVCPNCGKQHVYHLTDEERRLFKTNDIEVEGVQANPDGCPLCGYTGYAGRVPLHELLLINDDIKKILSTSEKAVAEIRDASKETDFRTLAQDGYDKMKLGLTTLEELRRVLG